MTIVASQLSPEILVQIEGLELRARHIVDGYLSGIHRSPNRGQSVEFTEHREYSVGDDLRYVDWKVFGKTDKVYLKQFETETNLVCYLLVDISESMRYQSDLTALSKLDYGQCLATALGTLILRQRDSVSLATFDDQIRDLVRESSNPTHLRHLIEVMENSPANRKSDIARALHEMSQRVTRRGIVVVFSDLLGDAEALLAGLKHLRHRRQEVIVLQLLDPAEVEFPFRQATLFHGLEALPEVLAEPRAVRNAYLAALKKFLKRVHEGCRAIQIDYALIQTDEPLDLALRRVLGSRTENKRL